MLCRPLLLLGVCLLSGPLGLAAGDARAQSREQISSQRPELPDFAPPLRDRGSILPPLDIPSAPGTRALSGGRRAHVRAYRIVGATVLGDDELELLTRPYRDRDVSYADLEALRDRITLAYVQRGYVSSGAVIPPQDISDETVEIRVVEGVLAGIDLETDGRFRPGILRSRLERHSRGPVNVRQLEHGLQLLQQDTRIRSVDAQLVPGAQRGESRLRVRTHEARPWDLHLEMSNHESPAIGGTALRVQGALDNLLGLGDTLAAGYGYGEGLAEIEGEYRLPLGTGGTELRLGARKSWTEVVEEPFDALDIESRTWTAGIALHHPVYTDLDGGLEIFASGEVRRSRSFLLGRGIVFAPGPEDDGTSKLTVLRLGLEWSRRSRDQVFVVRSTLSRGIDAFNATTHAGSVPDGRFLAALLQAQWARRLRWQDSLLLVRLDAQHTRDPLLGLEQIAVGGASSVRGYRENSLVRDRAILGSVELRVPVLLRGETQPLLELAAFTDAGYATRARGPSEERDTLWSAGLGARVHLGRGLLLEAYWGEDLHEEAPDPVDHDLQDSGFHLRLSRSFP